MARIIPENIVQDRSEQARHLLIDRYFPRFKKSQIIAYTLWFLLGPLGAHRFYLKHWKVGVGILMFWIVTPFILLFISMNIDPGSKTLPLLMIDIFKYMILGYMVVEGIILFQNVKKYNRNLVNQLAIEVGLA